MNCLPARTSSFRGTDPEISLSAERGDILLVGGPPDQVRKPLLLSIPHAGERVPPQTPWLKQMDKVLSLYDVDRAVDLLYALAIDELQVPTLVCPWHRYAADLNRLDSDVDQASVENAALPAGSFPRGFHWSMTTQGETLMSRPLSQADHKAIVELCYRPFHQGLQGLARELRARCGEILHLDLHSMPSVGTKEHRDPGERRKDVVISDQDGRSARTDWLEMVVGAYRAEGFSVAVNWPYKGGRITETYGRPHQGHHTIQVELNRGLYMNETTKDLFEDQLSDMQIRLAACLSRVFETLPEI